jgi:hypothetical protein
MAVLRFFCSFGIHRSELDQTLVRTLADYQLIDIKPLADIMIIIKAVSYTFQAWDATRSDSGS